MTNKNKWRLAELEVKSFMTSNRCQPIQAGAEIRGGGGQISNPTCGEDKCSRHCY